MDPNLTERILENIKKNLAPPIYSFLITLLSQLGAIDFWKPMDLYLLAAPLVERYFQTSGITYKFIVTTSEGAVIGEQALIEEAKR